MAGLAHSARTWNVGETVTKVMLDEQIRDNVNALLTNPWPIGSIFMATVSTNPATLLGFGTWVAFAQGRALFGAGTSDQVFTPGASGGESNHTLSTAEMPAHSHTFRDSANPVFHISAGTYTWVDDYNGAVTGDTSIAGSGGAHNNMPPFIVVYIWTRTA